MRRLQQDLLVVVEQVMSESTIRAVGQSREERDGGNVWDKLGSRWEGWGSGQGELFGGEDNDLVLGN